VHWWFKWLQLSSLFLILQEVDEPLHLNMSELCLSDEFLQGNSGKAWLHKYAVSYSDMDIVWQRMFDL